MADSILDMASPSSSPETFDPRDVTTIRWIDEETAVHLHQLVFDADDEPHAIVDLNGDRIVACEITGHDRNDGLTFGRCRTVAPEQFRSEWRPSVEADEFGMATAPEWAY